jgi:hypothetical protein
MTGACTKADLPFLATSQRAQSAESFGHARTHPPPRSRQTREDGEVWRSAAGVACARVSWLISPKTRGTSHLNCSGGTDRTQGRPKTFRSELDAKKFARAKLAETQHVTAGTLNPHLPKRTIAPAQMLEWLKEPDEDHLP